VEIHSARTILELDVGELMMEMAMNDTDEDFLRSIKCPVHGTV
jgi:hypothetical protein